MQRVKFEDLGLINYQAAWDYQEKLLQENVALKSDSFTVGLISMSKLCGRCVHTLC